MRAADFRSKAARNGSQITQAATLPFSTAARPSAGVRCAEAMCLIPLWQGGKCSA